VRIPPVEIDHTEVRAIQPTWHCLLRFRQRATPAIGTDAALEGLADALRGASIDTWPPPWAAGQEAARWAVADPWAFPLTPTGSGVWTAVTCLRR
jgi:hypothetical protein